MSAAGPTRTPRRSARPSTRAPPGCTTPSTTRSRLSRDAQGFTLHEEAGRRRRDILLVGDRPATQEERAAHDAAADAWEEAAERRAAAAADPDIPLADAVPRGGLWDATAAHWFGAMISGVEARRFSLRDYVGTAIAGAEPAGARRLRHARWRGRRRACP